MVCAEDWVGDNAAGGAGDSVSPSSFVINKVVCEPASKDMRIGVIHGGAR